MNYPAKAALNIGRKSSINERGQIYFLRLTELGPRPHGRRACLRSQVITPRSEHEKNNRLHIYNSWQLEKLSLVQGSDYLVLNDMGDLRTGQIVKFAGFDDVDNHYGIFVFIDATGKILEVKGDFSGREHPNVKELELAIKRCSP